MCDIQTICYNFITSMEGKVDKDIRTPVEIQSIDDIYKVFSYASSTIRIYGIMDDLWFCGKDISTALGYSDTNQAIRKHVSNDDKALLSTVLVRLNAKLVTKKSNSIYINKRGVTSLLINSRMPSKDLAICQFRDMFGIDISIVTILYKEQETIGQLMQAFRRKRILRQYAVLSYKIDMYLLDEKIAIECDEFGHKNRCQEYEMKRERDIKETLGCRMYRFNPDEKNFNIFHVIDDICKLIEDCQCLPSANLAI
jgi:very-short-patch-repair endonuclease